MKTAVPSCYQSCFRHENKYFNFLARGQLDYFIIFIFMYNYKYKFNTEQKKK
jgi:hypothetical protein